MSSVARWIGYVTRVWLCGIVEIEVGDIDPDVDGSLVVANMSCWGREGVLGTATSNS